MITGKLTALTGMTGTFTTDYTKAIIGEARVGKAKLTTGGIITGTITGRSAISGSIEED